MRAGLLFDTSSILTLVERGSLDLLQGGSTIELAFYEAVNAVWKQHYLLKRIDAQQAQEYTNLLKMVFTALDIRTIRGDEDKVLQLAVKEGLTAYDASYLHVALRDGLALVTQDRKLAERARHHVEVIEVKNLARRGREP